MLCVCLYSSELFEALDAGFLNRLWNARFCGRTCRCRRSPSGCLRSVLSRSLVSKERLGCCPGGGGYHLMVGCGRLWGHVQVSRRGGHEVTRRAACCLLRGSGEDALGRPILLLLLGWLWRRVETLLYEYGRGRGRGPHSRRRVKGAGHGSQVDKVGGGPTRYGQGGRRTTILLDRGVGWGRMVNDSTAAAREAAHGLTVVSRDHEGVVRGSSSAYAWPPHQLVLVAVSRLAQELAVRWVVAEPRRRPIHGGGEKGGPRGWGGGRSHQHLGSRLDLNTNRLLLYGLDNVAFFSSHSKARLVGLSHGVGRGFGLATPPLWVDLGLYSVSNFCVGVSLSVSWDRDRDRGSATDTDIVVIHVKVRADTTWLHTSRRCLGASATGGWHGKSSVTTATISRVVGWWRRRLGLALFINVGYI